jgi:hypothetical protein
VRNNYFALVHKWARRLKHEASCLTRWLKSKRGSANWPSLYCRLEYESPARHDWGISSLPDSQNKACSGADDLAAGTLPDRYLFALCSCTLSTTGSSSGIGPPPNSCRVRESLSLLARISSRRPLGTGRGIGVTGSKAVLPATTFRHSSCGAKATR